MGKLSCGCTPDASGFGYCSECTRNLNQKIWKNMSEKDKAFDRYVDAAGSAELDMYDDESECCSCHIMAPCSYCTNKNPGEDDE